MSAAEPFLCVVRRSESKWTVEAKWPDDSTEIVETFADYFEALRWLSARSTAWIDERVIVKEAGQASGRPKPPLHRKAPAGPRAGAK